MLAQPLHSARLTCPRRPLPRKPTGGRWRRRRHLSSPLNLQTRRRRLTLFFAAVIVVAVFIAVLIAVFTAVFTAFFAAGHIGASLQPPLFRDSLWRPGWSECRIIDAPRPITTLHIRVFDLPAVATQSRTRRNSTPQIRRTLRLVLTLLFAPFTLLFT